MAAAGLILVVFGGLPAWMLRQLPFDGLYGQDAFAYYDYAVGPLLGALRAGQPIPPFTWPPGYPLLVALASFAVGTEPLAGQVVSILAGAVAPVFTLLLAYEVWGRERGDLAAPLAAALLVGCMGQLRQSSVVVMADTAGLAAATAGMWALARYGRERRAGWLWLAAAGMSLAVLTRWAYALAALPAVVFALLCLAQTGRQKGWGRAAGTAIGAAIMVMLALWPLWEPVGRFLAGDGGGQSYLVDLEVYVWNPLNALRRQFLTADGLLEYRLPNGLYYALTPAHRFFLTPLLAVLLLPGLWVVWKEGDRAGRWLLLGWWGVVAAFHAGAPWQNFRFVLAFLPPVAITAAVGWAWARQRMPARWRWLATVWLLVGLAWMSWGGWSLTRSFVERKQADLQTVAWLAGEMPADAQLIAFQLTATIQHYSAIETQELFFMTETDLARWVAAGRPSYLFMEVANVERQWRDRSPGRNYEWLREQVGLVVAGQRGQYTLFRVADGADGDRR
ncbi:MAG: hypothetical protein Fur0021_40680 [Candidatus Promineifilaceae bacterium]